MSTKKEGKKNRKYGRNKRPIDQATSAYVRGKITFDQYIKKKGV